MVTEPPPIDTRSLPNAAIATLQPSFTAPTTSRSGTNTSSKNTSLNSVSPVISVSGRISHRGIGEVDDHRRNALVLAHIRIGAHGGQPALAVHGVAGPHLLTGDHPAAVDPPGLGGNRRRIRARARLTEQLAPPQLALEARPDQSVDLLGASVLQQRRHHPFAESEAGLVQTRRRASSMINCSTLSAARPYGAGQCGCR